MNENEDAPYDDGYGQHDAMREKMQELRDMLVLTAGKAAEDGIEVAPLLADLDEFLAALNGEGPPGYDVKAFISRLGEFSAEVSQTQHLLRQAELVSTVVSVDQHLQDLHALAAQMQTGGDAAAQRAGADLQALAGAVLAKLSTGQSPLDELQDLTLRTAEEAAVIERRQHLRIALTCLWWESRPPEWWAALPPDAHTEFTRLLTLWREGEREKILGTLPIADRRRIESLTPAELDRKETWDVVNRGE